MTDHREAAAEWKARLDKVLTDLQPEVDALRVRIHLARKEAKDEFADWEQKFAAWRVRADVTGEEAGEILEEKARAIRAELKDGLERLRKLV
jgi:F0F1-type ATP synthase membrane subunit b/b'